MAYRWWKERWSSYRTMCRPPVSLGRNSRSCCKRPYPRKRWNRPRCRWPALESCHNDPLCNRISNRRWCCPRKRLIGLRSPGKLDRRPIPTARQISTFKLWYLCLRCSLVIGSCHALVVHFWVLTINSPVCSKVLLNVSRTLLLSIIHKNREASSALPFRSFTLIICTYRAI